MPGVQSVVLLLAGKLEEGIEQLRKIGTENFQYDGKAPKVIMTQDGTIYKPVSKLFLLYNYAKVLKKREILKALKLSRKNFLMHLLFMVMKDIQNMTCFTGSR